MASDGIFVVVNFLSLSVVKYLPDQQERDTFVPSKFSEEDKPQSGLTNFIQDTTSNLKTSADIFKLESISILDMHSQTLLFTFSVH